MGTIGIFSIWWFIFIFFKLQHWCKVLCLINCNHNLERFYYTFNLKIFYYSYAWSCSLCKSITSFCMGRIPRKLCRFLIMFSTSFTSLSALLLFLNWSLSLLLCTVSDSISSNIDEVLLINPSANVFVFRDCNKDLVHSAIIFLSPVTLLGWITFLLGSLDTVLLFWIYFSAVQINIILLLVTMNRKLKKPLVKLNFWQLQ